MLFRYTKYKPAYETVIKNLNYNKVNNIYINSQLSFQRFEHVSESLHLTALAFMLLNTQEIFLKKLDNYERYSQKNFMRIFFFKFFRQPLVPRLWNFATSSFYLSPTFYQNFMVRDAINSKLWYFCRGYPINFFYFSVVLILWKTTLCLLDIAIHPRC